MSTSSAPKKLLQTTFPLFVTMILLGGNSYLFGDKASQGANQFALLLGGLLAWLTRTSKNVDFSELKAALWQTCRPILPTFSFLLMVAAMSVTWVMSGITPAIIYYGLSFLTPHFFLVTVAFLCALVSIMTGSSWATIATLGIALLEIGKALGWSEGLIAGAIISGAYFGDKISPLSETTLMASAVTGTPLSRHIRAMLWTSIPTFCITLFLFFLIGYSGYQAEGNVMGQSPMIRQYLAAHFRLTPFLFLVPLIVFLLIILQVPPTSTLCMGALMGVVVVFIVQPPILVSSWEENTFISIQKLFHLLHAAVCGIRLGTSDEAIMVDLLTSGGMVGMIPTLTLILAALVMGALLQVSGTLETLTSYCMQVRSRSALIFMATLTGILLNLTVADQYLAILLGGKMYRLLFEKRGLASSDLSRTLEDSITVTSPLIPWNTCGAAQSTVLGVATLTYLPYCLFNLLSPFVGVLLAYIGIGMNKRKESSSPRERK